MIGLVAEGEPFNAAHWVFVEQLRTNLIFWNTCLEKQSARLRAVEVMRTPELNYLDGWKYGFTQNKDESRCVENWKIKKQALEQAAEKKNIFQFQNKLRVYFVVVMTKFFS